MGDDGRCFGVVVEGSQARSGSRISKALDSIMRTYLIMEELRKRGGGGSWHTDATAVIILLLLYVPVCPVCFVFTTTLLLAAVCQYPMPLVLPQCHFSGFVATNPAPPVSYTHLTLPTTPYV